MYEEMGHLRCRQRRIGITRKGGSTYGIGKDSLIVQNVLCPVHEGVDVIRRSKLRRALVAHTVFPKILISYLRYDGQALRAWAERAWKLTEGQRT